MDDYSWGAAVATDLVNTAPEVQVTRGEQLPDGAALAAFLAEHDVHPDALADRPATAADVAAVHRLRADLRTLIESPDPADAAARAGRLSAAAGGGPFLQMAPGGRWHWHVCSRGGGAAEELALLTATALQGVLRTLGHDRFRQCAAPDCTGVFVDTSRAGRRRYCVPEVCGNRINVANHRARRRAAPPDQRA
ncbi:CGNR zinc finger domain-containing protein [Pseudonocardia nigra]|uniref:CGNR zinc finger domain-containing protein n=1 Tax=Pseudonocardia nigra TaxID=1921578 RepID=UPI001FE2F1F0|nr:CGNR zinc finger domain-containing protein [Pseudonocardia nigra]